MNILYLFGNGFDLNLGMKTSYSDFYKYYQKIETDNSILQSLKRNITDKHKNWSDLELALGDYTENLKNSNELDIVIEDLGIQLAAYLKSQENKTDFDNIDKDKFQNDLIFPENYLLQADKNEISKYKSQWATNDCKINIITYNYTNSIENIFGEKHNNIEIGKTRHNKIAKLERIEHIHGYIDNRMVMGVNDLSQVKNQSFHNDIDIKETIVKPDCNQAIKHTIDDWGKREIARANLICVFGSSIGESDKLWWELIGERLKGSNFKLIIFSRLTIEISERISHKKQREVRNIISDFLDKTNLENDDRAFAFNKIFVGLNTEIFNIN